MQGVKKLQGEDIVNYETHVKKYREVARYDELTSEQSRELFVILTAGDQKTGHWQNGQAHISSPTSSVAGGTSNNFACT